MAYTATVAEYSLLVLCALIISTSVSASPESDDDPSSPFDRRIDCYPEKVSPYSNYSKESCLARHCLYDDHAHSNTTQCYVSPTYGYIQEGPIEKMKNGFRVRLQRNQAVASMFPEPIESALLEVQYYTNDIIRFKLYDANQQRYEVEEHARLVHESTLLLLSRYPFI